LCRTVEDIDTDIKNSPDPTVTGGGKGSGGFTGDFNRIELVTGSAGVPRGRTPPLRLPYFGYRAVQPPSIKMSEPVMNPECSEHK
jgi:hypothetical protein